MHFQASRVEIDCSDETEFPNVEQPKQQEEAEAQGAGFDGRSLIKGAQGAVAAVCDFLWNDNTKPFIEGALDAKVGDGIGKYYKETLHMKTAWVRGLGQVSTGVMRSAAPLLRGLSKILGPVAVCQGIYDINEDLEKYEGNDALKAASVTVGGVVIGVLVGVACVAAAAPTATALGLGGLAGLAYNEVSKSLKDGLKKKPVGNFPESGHC